MTFDPIKPIKPWDGVKKPAQGGLHEIKIFSQKINQAEVLDLVFVSSRMVLPAPSRGIWNQHLRKEADA
jgi:hypothetical protein